MGFLDLERGIEVCMAGGVGGFCGGEGGVGA